MKRISMLSRLLALLSLLLLVGCGERKPVLYVYNWADYMADEVIAAFEKAYNCRVVVDTFDSNEAMLAKIKAGGSGYDLIFPSSYMAALMFEQGLLQNIDHDLLPNLGNIDQEYLDNLALDPAMVYSVPYMISNSGVGYRISRVGDIPQSWSVFADESFRGRMTLLNDMRETIGAALKYLGYSLNSVDEQELAEARDVVIAWKRNIAKFDSEGYKPGLASGEFFIVHGYNGDILQVMDENDDVDYFVPGEGTSIACDDMVIPVGARSPELAHAFINFLLDPEQAAINVQEVYFLAPNSAVYPLLPEEMRENESIFLPEEIFLKSEVIRDLGEHLPKWVRVWDEIKAAN